MNEYMRRSGAKPIWSIFMILEGAIGQYACEIMRARGVQRPQRLPEKKSCHVFSLAIHPSFDTSSVLRHSSSPKKGCSTWSHKFLQKAITIIDIVQKTFINSSCGGGPSTLKISWSKCARIFAMPMISTLTWPMRQIFQSCTLNYDACLRDIKYPITRSGTIPI